MNAAHLECKRRAYRRRLQAIRDARGLRRLTNRQRNVLLDLCMQVRRTLTDEELIRLARLANDGLCG